MARLKHTDLGVRRGVCACCFADTELHMRESRFVRTWRNRFDRSFVPQVQRTAHCSECKSTYPVRASDPTPAAAAKRVAKSNGVKRSTDPATLSSGRDWRDTSVRV